MINLLTGASAGTIAASITYPSDLVRRRMQLSGSPGHRQYTNMLNCFVRVVQEEGPFALYKGYFANLLKVAPSMAVMFWSNELLKSLL